MVQARSLIDGELLPAGSAGSVQVHAPYDGTLVGTAPVSGSDEVERAISAAEKKFATWGQSGRSERQALVSAVAKLVEKRSEDLSVLLAQEVGKPITWARAEVVRLGLTFGLAASLLDGPEREELGLGFDARGKEFRCFVERVPFGPVFAIVPYNWPYNLAAHKLAPALAAGCTVVLKPSPLAPLSTLRLAELIHEAGCPAGALNAVLCSNEDAESIARDPRIKLVSFTGSERVGWHLKSLVPEKPVVLEMGGDANVLVFDDADLSLAVQRTALGAYGYAGQVCISVQHLRVQSSVYETVRDAMVRETESTATGDPMDESAVCGPMINAEAADRVMEWIEEAERAGATVLAGGNRVGNVVEPTLLEDVPSGCRIATEEAFGPVLTISRFSSEEEAFARANSSRFGIHCGVFTKDAGRIERAYRALEVSGVIVNDFPTLRFDNMPYGGVKRSGTGREGVRYAYEEMTLPKVLLQRR